MNTLSFVKDRSVWSSIISSCHIQPRGTMKSMNVQLGALPSSSRTPVWAEVVQIQEKYNIQYKYEILKYTNIIKELVDIIISYIDNEVTSSDVTIHKNNYNIICISLDMCKLIIKFQYNEIDKFTNINVNMADIDESFCKHVILFNYQDIHLGLIHNDHVGSLDNINVCNYFNKYMNNKYSIENYFDIIEQHNYDSYYTHSNICVVTSRKDICKSVIHIKNVYLFEKMIIITKLFEDLLTKN